MDLIFLYGPAAAGKLTVGRALAARTGLPLFHNHLVVDAVLAVFPFGSAPFVRLRERFWMQMFEEAAAEGRSLIFTFAPEPSVDDGFPDRVRKAVEARGGRVSFVALTLTPDEQARRIDAPSRGEFRKLRDPDLLQTLRAGFERSLSAMPQAALTVDTSHVAPEAAAAMIAEALNLPPATPAAAR